LQTHQLTKRFGDFTALDGLTISVDKGKILGFIGPNGAGKTTTIRILVGLLRPTSGTARIAGVDCVRDARKLKRVVGYMPEQFGTYDNMRVSEYLDFFGAAFRIPRRLRARRIAEALELTGATYMRDLYVEALSHGMQQRIGIARTLLHDPQVLILDEPAKALDPHARIEMRELLLQLAAAGRTLIVTSHILPELSRICSVVAIIVSGRLRAYGTLEEIMARIKQRRTFEVQLLEASQVEMAQEAIAQAFGAEAEPQMAVSAAEAVVRLETDRTDSQLTDLLSLLIDRGVRVAQFREVPSDLEDAFLSVTREDAPETAGSEAGGGETAGDPASAPVATAAGESEGSS
jgi:ABC-2 type transport system ATP-binding protein